MPDHSLPSVEIGENVSARPFIVRHCSHGTALSREIRSLLDRADAIDDEIRRVFRFVNGSRAHMNETSNVRRPPGCPRLKSQQARYKQVFEETG